MMLYFTFTTYLPTDDFQGDSNLSFVWFLFKNMGMHVPSLTTNDGCWYVLSCVVELIFSFQHLSDKGIPYYSISLSGILSQCTYDPSSRSVYEGIRTIIHFQC